MSIKMMIRSSILLQSHLSSLKSPFFPIVSMINTLSWNIRGVRSQGSLERLKTLKNQHKFPYIFLQEPKVNQKNIEKFKRRLGYPCCFYNCYNKIWIFWSIGYQLDIIEDKEQHVLIHITYLHEPVDFHLFMVYAKCEEALRISLWDDLRDISGRITGPWGVVGDFNVITCSDEKNRRKSLQNAEKFWLHLVFGRL